ncbi:MAG TPA: ATP-dependent protease, partial [Firmicutes bacterium]|nr:ATP-dependent protease [Bacillota bacterium]
LICLLSSIAEVPLRQDLAVTGSVNQKGEIQPIGAVNSKIEGFYLACKAVGLTGSQGVVIPEQNRPNLMLKKEVLQAVKHGKFHIYAVKTVDEGLELLSGMKAGRQKKDGTYPIGSFNARVLDKLKEYNKTMKDEKADLDKNNKRKK